MLLSGGLGLDSVYYKASDTFMDSNLWVDIKRQRIIRFTVGTVTAGNFNSNVVLAVYDMNMENKQEIIYDKLDYTNLFRGAFNKQYYDYDTGIIYASMNVANAISGGSDPIGFTLELCKLEIDFSNASNTTIDIVGAFALSNNINVIFYYDAATTIVYYSNGRHLRSLNITTQTELTTITLATVGSNPAVGSFGFNVKDKILYALAGGVNNASRFYVYNFATNTLISTSTNSITVSGRISGLILHLIDDKYKFIYSSRDDNDELSIRIYDSNLNLIQGSSTIPLLSGSVVSGEQSNKSVILQNDL